MEELQVYNRADIVNFIGLTLNATVFQRMKGFTDGGKSLNSQTYDRRYIDEKTERSDVIAYATEISYGFDRIKGDAVTEMLAKVHDDELVGFTRPIVTVNFNEPVEGGGFRAKMRNWSVQPDSDGDSTDAYTYSGAFKANGSIIAGVAKVVEGSENDTENITAISFTADGEQATQLVTFSVKDDAGQVAGAKIVIDSLNTIYTDLTGIASIDLPTKNYSNINISKSGYTTQSNVSVNVADSAVFKEITLVEA